MGVGLILKLPMPHQLVLQGTEKTFYRRGIVAIAFATHAQDHSASSEHDTIEPGAVLIALIAVMHQPRGRMSTLLRHPPGRDTADKVWRGLIATPRPIVNRDLVTCPIVSQPARVGTNFRSPAHTRSFADTANCRLRRFGMAGVSCWRTYTVRI
jgi:hypothetical protein